jgi:hypothetical protein
MSFLLLHCPFREELIREEFIRKELIRKELTFKKLIAEETHNESLTQKL